VIEDKHLNALRALRDCLAASGIIGLIGHILFEHLIPIDVLSFICMILFAAASYPFALIFIYIVNYKMNE
jgi:hypothetical protein